MKKTILLLFLATGLFVACDQNDIQETPPADKAFVIDMDEAEDLEFYDEETIESRRPPTFNTIQAAINCTGVLPLLQEGKRTLFAPTDKAFAKLGLGPDNVCDIPLDQLTAILAYHVSVENVSRREQGCIEMLDGNIAHMTQVRRRPFINGTRIRGGFTQRQEGSELRLYIINEVLTVPTENIVATASSIDVFSSLVAAIGAADPAIAAALSDEEAIWTVFAPTNDAFAALLSDLGLNSLEELVEVLGVENLSTVLLYHVADACAFSNDLRNGQRITTLQGENVTVNLRVPGIVDKTGVVAPLNTDVGIDVLTSNGIVHTIDKVLLPEAILEQL